MTANSAPANSAPADRRPAPRRTVRNAILTLGLTGALALGGALPATASAAEPPRTAGGELVLAWCPLGTYGGPGGGCRGGGINDNERLNDAARETGKMYADAGECAGKAVGKSILKNRKRLSLPSIGLGTIKPGIKCGQSKGY